MFLERLDGARIQYFAPEGEYGRMHYETGGIGADFKYLAICQYHGSDKFCLFCGNARKEVETDSLWDSMEACMSVAECFWGKTVLWSEK